MPAKKQATKVTKLSDASAKAVAAAQAKRFATFDSALAEAEAQPIAFLLDGKEWDCHPLVAQSSVTMFRTTGSSVLDFVTSSVIDSDGWTLWLAENSVPHESIKQVFAWLIEQYFGEESGKS